MASKTDNESRRQQVADRYLAGASIAEIAAILTTDAAAVRRDLAAVRKQWSMEAATESEDRIAETLAGIRRIRLQAFAEWERSKLPAETTVDEITEGEGSKRKTSKRKQGQHGDARLLSVALASIEAEAKLLGLNAPTGIDATIRTIEPIRVIEVRLCDEPPKTPALAAGDDTA